MTTAEFAKMLDGRSYGQEITPAESKKAKELGFVVVFGSSDDNAELEGAICDEIGCYNGGELKHDDLPKPITAIWDPEGKDCSWAYETELPHDEFQIYDDGELYCVGIVCDINNKQGSAPVTNAENFRAMKDEELAKFIRKLEIRGLQDSYCVVYSDDYCVGDINTSCTDCILKWLRQPAETEGKK